MASRNPPARIDAIDLLKEEHRKVKELFSEFKKFEEDETEGAVELKQELMDVVCMELRIHTQIEEEILYPAAREALPDEDALMNEADVEHAGAKDLIAQILDGYADDPMTCARFLVLSEQIDHHVKEEHDEMFPKLRKSTMDLEKVGRALAERRRELESDYARGALPMGAIRPTVFDPLSAYTGP